MFLITQILGLIGTILAIIAMQLKEKKKIIILFTIGNFIYAVSFTLLGAYSGAAICFIAAVQTAITYVYESRDKKLSELMILFFIVTQIIAGVFTFIKVIDILPVICSILYVFSIIQKKERNIRILLFSNVFLWIIFDVYVAAYTTMISHLFIIVSTSIAIIRYDVIKKMESKIESKEVNKYT